MARSCEACGSRMSPFLPRKRRAADNKLVCPGCEGLNPQPFEARRATATTKVRCSGCSADLNLDQTRGTITGTVPSNGVRGQGHQPAHDKTALVVNDDGLLRWDCPVCGYPDSYDAQHYASRRIASSEVEPGDVVTFPGGSGTVRKIEGNEAEVNTHDGWDGQGFVWIPLEDLEHSPPREASRKVAAGWEDSLPDRVRGRYPACPTCGSTTTKPVPGMPVFECLENDCEVWVVRPDGSSAVRSEKGKDDPYNDPFNVALEEAFNRRRATRKVAHDSGDGETIYHCPFCGAGQVTGRSDGTAECGFCQTTFTVQVQPQRAAVPQTIDGEPHVHPDMPGSGAGDPGVPEDEEDPVDEETEVLPREQEDNPIFAKRFFVTEAGVALPEEAYLRHLAIKHAHDPDGVLAQVRAENGTRRR